MEIVDEPFYANFLREPDVNKLVNEVIFGPGTKKYRYCKQIAYECPPGIISDLLKKGKHFILIRSPLYILLSFQKVSPASFLELGFPGLLAIYTQLSEYGAAPPVINAEDLQNDPETILRGLCEDLGIPFQASMLRWEAGPKEFDGVWAPWWYKSVHKSTCFSKPHKYPPAFPFEVYDLLEQSMPFYHMLNSKVKKRTSSSLLPNGIQPVPVPVPINERTLVWVGGELVPCGIAKVSVFDCILEGGHVVLEGLCAYNGKVFKLNEHLERILYSAKDLAVDQVLIKEAIKEALFKTLISNGMLNSACIKLALICCKKVAYGKCLSHDDLYKRTLIVLVERKEPFCDNSAGMKLITRSPMLNNSPTLEGNVGKARDAIILNKDGFLSKINATNIVVELINRENLTLHEQKISLSEFHTADEIVMINSCVIGNGEVGPVTKRVLAAYKDLIEESGVTIPVNLDG
ncbi:branched-chain-amino-acid aminotransferase-like protein 2 isoform X2 [Carex littledalei]|uniref:Branched-chain-amino-acid aminotransferase-like protein 2 isoform X2 n=1 Tax=Carex littledalei TaxID=544730 RepID=A0A833QN74_9POAL|nr:branched-chain-amino-acid aminotransferase-like protein 2 isoform X2 [Carex littledalei]